ncbi:hypothetical protein PT7_3201 [Pusillimonas sp. T7-7]|uniref:hypothetical protein n=1 Tax=Pusillimonas sp. (strain T7-7) TaxID=1007105 RepID=UPI0002084D09|nr:hypothetical protein [Pusillimonas sp. T7-7]AEC21741.1 hypothetical protein PT7_3201 [Pusillimonas sp. T7-7]
MPDLCADDFSGAPSPDSVPTQAPPDYDGAWKNALDAYFPGFMALFWPALHAQIDWAHKPVFLDKELQKLVVSSKHGRLHVDKLARVRLLSGQDVQALIHVEIQGGIGYDSGLPARMFTYHMRLREKHPKHPLVSLAILLHRRTGPSTQVYTYSHWGCSLEFRFPVVHLQGWRSRMNELLRLAPHNPFAVVVLAQLEANAKYPDEQQLVRKTALVRHLHDWGFERNQIVQLFNILDAMLVLPVSMEQRFIDAINQIEEEYNMTYVNTIERVALRRGREEGKQEGGRATATSILIALITRKFGEVPNWAQARLAGADQSSLDRWAVQILDAKRIEDVFA